MHISYWNTLILLKLYSIVYNISQIICVYEKLKNDTISYKKLYENIAKILNLKRGWNVEKSYGRVFNFCYSFTIWNDSKRA